MDLNWLLLISVLLIGLIPAYQANGASLSSMATQKDGPFISMKSEQPEAASASRGKLLRFRRQAITYDKRSPRQIFNNEQDVATTNGDRLQQQLRRLATNGPTDSLALSPANQLLEQEEQAILRRQLPELLAQAHNDKSTEKALLKMLINASLRSALTNVLAPQLATNQLATSNYYNSNGRQLNYADWQDGEQAYYGDTTLNSALLSPRMTARLEQAISEYASLDPLVNDLGQTLQQESSNSGIIDKREYIKPCSFNAVSCAKNPFRKPI